MPLPPYPKSFEEKIIGAFGEPGRSWLKELPSIVKTYLEKWELTFVAPFDNLSYNYVIQVTDHKGTPLVLKCGLRGTDFTNEIRALEAYQGDQCAKLIQADPEAGVILLEKVSPGHMLREEKDESRVLDVFMQVWKATRRELPKGVTLPKITDWAAGFDRIIKGYEGSFPISLELIDQARTYFQDFSASPRIELLHGDLHHQNILYSDERGWMAIDPKGLAGDPYLDLIQFMNNELHNQPNPKALLKQRVDILSEGLQLDRKRVIKAGVAMTTLFACWSIEDHSSDWNEGYQTALWFQAFSQGK